MKAAIINEYGNYDLFKISDEPIPEIAENEILIQVIASSVNPIDWKIRQGNHKYTLGTSFPIILGFDASGVIEKTGKAAKKFKIGDKVYGRLDKKYGKALAEYAVGSESVFAKIPDSLTFEEAAAIPLAACTALQALRDKGNIKKNDEVLIIGATGGVGHFGIQVAKNFGAKVTAVCGNGHDEMLSELKPDKIINYTTQDVLKLNSHFDIIFDAAGKYTFRSMNHLLNPNGVYINTLPRLKILFHKLIAAFSNGKKVRTLLMKPNFTDLELINKWIDNNSFKAYIDQVFPLEEISKAHMKSEEYHTEGKIVVRINQ